MTKKQKRKRAALIRESVRNETGASECRVWFVEPDGEWNWRVSDNGRAPRMFKSSLTARRAATAFALDHGFSSLRWNLVGDAEMNRMIEKTVGLGEGRMCETTGEHYLLVNYELVGLDTAEGLRA